MLWKYHLDSDISRYYKIAYLYVQVWPINTFLLIKLFKIILIIYKDAKWLRQLNDVPTQEQYIV